MALGGSWQRLQSGVARGRCGEDEAVFQRRGGARAARAAAAISGVVQSAWERRKRRVGKAGLQNVGEVVDVLRKAVDVHLHRLLRTLDRDVDGHDGRRACSSPAGRRRDSQPSAKRRIFVVALSSPALDVRLPTALQVLREDTHRTHRVYGRLLPPPLPPSACASAALVSVPVVVRDCQREAGGRSLD